jgi:anaerobic selenocysteine-containing dehydrogenase
MPNEISRRDFVKLGVMTTASAVLAGCQSPRRYVELEAYVRPPEEELAGTATWYASTCRQCPAGCGIVVRIMNGRAKKIEGNGEHPLNRGKLCARGQSGLQVLYNPDRLQGPVQQARRGSRQFQPVNWNEAINTLSAKTQTAGSAVAIWGGSTLSGHVVDLFTRFTKAIGAQPPVLSDLYSSFHGYQLLSAANRDLFGAALLPTYDLAQADVVFSFGADFAATGLSAVRYGAEYGAFRSQALGKRGYLVQFEPKMTITGAKADRWLPIKPGSEGLVALAVARIIADRAFGSSERVARARTIAATADVNGAAAAADITVEELTRLAQTFATAGRPLAIPGHALTALPNGAEVLKAVQALNIMAGNVNQPGGMSVSPALQKPPLAQRNLSSLTDVLTLIKQMQDGKVQVLLIDGANPAYDLPPKLGFVEALQKVPFVVSFAPIVDETALWSDLILPGRTYLESWGYEVVSPGFETPVVSGQQPVVAPVYDSRSTADILLAVAQRIPATAQTLTWKDEVAFLKETVVQLGAGAAGGSGDGVLWSRFLQHGGWWPAAAPAAAPAQTAAPVPLKVAATTFQGDEATYPFFLHIFMNDLLSDGRGASQPWLQGSPDGMTTISWQTWVEINPRTAQSLGVQDGDIVTLTSPNGEVEALVYTFPAIRPDTLAIPLGLGHTDLGRFAMNRGSNPMNLVGTALDATGNGLAWAALRVKISRTGRRAELATFENKAGVTNGFINQAFPGG